MLGSWWDAPRGDFPIRGIAARMKDLRDSEIVQGENGFLVAVGLYEDDVGYGYAVMVSTTDTAFMVLFRGPEDWEAFRRFVAEKRGSTAFEVLVEELQRLAERGSGDIELS